MIQDSLAQIHKICDEIFCAFEELVHQNRWDEAETTFADFRTQTLAHLDFEEQVLFPAFEQATGILREQGPTGVMIAEHKQIRDYIEAIGEALEQRQSEKCLDLGDTLMITIGQHNMKEERILYPMCDEHLDADILKQL